MRWSILDCGSVCRWNWIFQYQQTWMEMVQTDESNRYSWVVILEFVTMDSRKPYSTLPCADFSSRVMWFLLFPLLYAFIYLLLMLPFYVNSSPSTSRTVIRLFHNVTSQIIVWIPSKQDEIHYHPTFHQMQQTAYYNAQVCTFLFQLESKLF